MKVKVASAAPGNELTQNVTAGEAFEHHLKADEPKHVEGGANQGPTPTEYLLASLGACTSITLRMYARHKGWPLESVEVVLSDKKVKSADGKEPVVEIMRAIKLSGPLTAEQRQRLMEIAAKCPIHKVLTHEILITDSLEI